MAKRSPSLSPGPDSKYSVHWRLIGAKPDKILEIDDRAAAGEISPIRARAQRIADRARRAGNYFLPPAAGIAETALLGFPYFTLSALALGGLAGYVKKRLPRWWEQGPPEPEDDKKASKEKGKVDRTKASLLARAGASHLHKAAKRFGVFPSHPGDLRWTSGIFDAYTPGPDYIVYPNDEYHKARGRNIPPTEEFAKVIELGESPDTLVHPSVANGMPGVFERALKARIAPTASPGRAVGPVDALTASPPPVGGSSTPPSPTPPGSGPTGTTALRPIMRTHNRSTDIIDTVPHAGPNGETIFIPANTPGPTHGAIAPAPPTPGGPFSQP